MTKNNESMKLKIYISICTYILCIPTKNFLNWIKNKGVMASYVKYAKSVYLAMGPKIKKI